MVTARDVANLAETSTAVVSYVFNNGPRNVSAATRARVMAAAAELNYQPNALARALSAGRTQSIGLIVPDICNPYFAELARAIEVAAESTGNLLLIGDSAMSPDQERRHVRSFIERKVDSVVMVSVSDEPQLDEFFAAGIPVVALHPVADRERTSSLTIDYVEAAAMATEHLVEHGYPSIGLLNGPTESTGSLQHRQGFLAGLGGGVGDRGGHGRGGAAGATLGAVPGEMLGEAPEEGLGEMPGEVPAELPDEMLGEVIASERSSVISRHAAAQVAREWLAEEDRPRAIYCSTDEQAFGVLFAAYDLGLRVPQDVAVIGFDGTANCRVSIPPLTTVQQPTTILATRVIELLDGRTTADTVVHETLEFDFILRRSCGCPGT